MIVPKSFRNLWGATAPCTRLPAILLAFQSLAADCEYALYFDMSESTRAAIEPFRGLKMSCPSLEPRSFSQLRAGVRFLIPLGRPKESESIMKTPLVEGAGAQPKS